MEDGGIKETIILLFPFFSCCAWLGVSGVHIYPVDLHTSFFFWRTKVGTRKGMDFGVYFLSYFTFRLL